ncbi:MAG: hypothetical protein ACREDR_44980, partial [Blastocatellia bacterium]
MPEKSSTSAVGAYLIAQEPAGKKVESFLRVLFHLLDEYDVRYCVLHSWESLPEGLSSDLDLAAHRQDASKVSSVFQQLQAGGYTPVQCLNYFAHCYQFAFHWFEGDASKVAIVDLMFEHRRAGMIFATGDEIVANRHRHREFWIPSSRAEFGYLLAKKTWKRGASAGQVIRLRQLAAEIGLAEAEGIASQFLGTKSKKRIAQACAKGTVHEILANGRRELWKNALLRHPLTAIRFVVAECQRAVYRWLHPTGVLVAVLGPDGAGKSAVIDRLLADVGPLFRHQRLFHWRPGFLGHGKDAGPNLDPQGQIPRGALFSVFY